MFKKSIVIILPIIFVIGLIFGYGIKQYNSRYIPFQADGHVITTESKTNTAKHFFDTNTKYRISEDNVTLSYDDEKVVIPKETFIHFADGAISTFSKSVVLNLDNIEKKNDSYIYYNIFPETVFRKGNGGYTINYLDKTLTFKNFLLKINDDKYMIIGSKYKVNIGDNEKEFKNDYIEINYLDGNLIKIENQASAYQSISDNVTIEFNNDVIIDLIGKNIYKDQTRTLSLGEITIDSDDNIEINAEDNKLITEKGKEKDKEKEDKTKETSKDGNNSNNDGSSNSSKTENSKTNTKKNTSKKYSKDELPSMSSGVVDTSTDSLEEIIDANARIKDAEFKINNLEVTANRLRAEVQIIDTEGVLLGDIDIKIIESSTNRIVYETRETSGSNMIDIENESLMPETNYILILNSDYKKNDVIYNKDFIQKTFVTETVGVSLDKYFVAEERLEVNIKKADYSDVASVDVNLENSSGKVLKQETLQLENADNFIEYTELIHDTQYKVRVYNFVYKDYVVSNNFTLLETYETLKRKPTIGNTSFTMDKKESKLNMMLNSTTDPDSGIKSYKYEVYDARDLENEDARPVAVVEKGNNASASVKVDGKSVKRGVPYVFRCVMSFNDNEKEYDYVSEYSDVMKLDGVEFPIVRFNKSEVTFERIAGEIEIIDEGNTIDVNGDNIILITFTDSVGISKSFSSSGSLKIPFDINNLRSNETYSFSVSTKVDLQDGNPPIDSCYVGSVIIKTEDPNPFQMSFSLEENLQSAFSISAKLIKGNKGDTELEAKTLTGLSFNLYHGKNTSGRLVKTVKIVDKNLDPYISDIKSKYYENYFLINPSFFELKNSDLTSEFYTIEVTGAYDYTDYHNAIPISNNTFTVKTANALPDIPSNPNDAVDIIAIRNRDLDENKKREDLDESTTVGYRLKAIYNNEAKYAKKITYYFFNSVDEQVDKIEYNVPVTGEINYIEKYIEDGVVNSDGKLRRGEKFYVRYTIELDTNYDGTIDLIYPLSGDLRSRDISPLRQEPNIQLYPSTATNDSYSWKYKYKDVDHALYNHSIYSYINGLNNETIPIDITDEYKTVTFTLRNNANFAIYAKYNLLNEYTPVDKKLTSQYYEGVNNLDFGKINLYPEKNRVIFNFNDFEAKRELFDRVNNIKIEFKSGSDKVVLDGLSTQNGNLTINYSSLESLMGKVIQPTVTFYYDSGIYGFDTTGDAFALQKIRSDESDPISYYHLNKGRLSSSSIASGSYATFEFDVNNRRLTYKDKLTNETFTSMFSIETYGVLYNSDYVSMKKVNNTNVAIINGDTFSFDSIIPGISLLNESGRSSITPLINTADYVISGYGMENKLKEDKIYVELYKTDDELGTNPQYVKTINFNISKLNTKLSIDGLLPQTNYFFKVYGYVIGTNGSYTKSYLYDVNQLREEVNYYFKTIGNVGIDNLNVQFYAFSYTDRRLKLTYTLDKTIGYSYITYKIYKIIDNTEEILMKNAIPNKDTRFNENMISYIKIPNTSGVTTGYDYRVEVQPVLVVKEDGVDREIMLESKSTQYKFNKLYKPYFSVMASSSSDKILFRVNIQDYRKVMVDGNYTIRITTSDGEDITPSEYQNKTYKYSDINQLFEINNLTANNSYVLHIIYDADLENDVEKIDTISYLYSTKATSHSNETIDPGNVYAETNSDDSTKINLRFFGSSHLTDVKFIRYSIYNETEFSIDNQVSFKPNLHTSGSTTYYEFQLPDTISNEGIYYISIQYLDFDGNILYEGSIDYHLL